MKKIFTLLSVIIFLGCERPVVPAIKFRDGKELILLSSFLQHEKEYDYIGSYDLKGKPLSTGFYIGSKLNLDIIYLGKISDKTTYNIIPNISDMYGFSTGINGNLFYHAGKPDNSELKRVDIYTDETIEQRIINDSIAEYNIRYNKFIIQFNSQDDFGIHAEPSAIGQANAEFVLYKKQNNLYLLFLTTADQSIRPKKGTLLKYLQTKWQPDLDISMLSKKDEEFHKRIGNKHGKTIDSMENSLRHSHSRIK